MTSPAMASVEPRGTAPAGGTGPGSGERSDTWRARLPQLFLESAVVWFLLIILLVTTILTDGFWDADNLKNVLTQNAPLALVVIGMTFVIISGVFDLSVGAIFAAGAVVYAKFSGTMSLELAALLTLGVGTVAGLINGAVVTRLHVDPFIGTIGTGGAFVGLLLIFSDSQPILVNDEAFRSLGLGSTFGIPTPVLIAGIGFLVGGLLLSRTVFGRYIYASGGNQEAARLAGIPVDAVRMGAYVLVALGAVAGGMLTASQLSVGQPTLGANTALDAFTIVVIGGTSVYGGRGAIWRTFVGLLIVAVLNTFFNLLALEGAYQQLAKGTVLVLAVALDSVRHRQGQR